MGHRSPKNENYKVAQVAARAHKQWRGKVLWTSCIMVDGLTLMKEKVQGTYRRK